MNWRILPLLVIVAALAAIGTLAYTANHPESVPSQQHQGPEQHAPNTVTLPDGSIVTSEPGVPITYSRVESQSDQGGTVRKDQQGSATGAGLTSDSQDAVLGFKASAPSMWLESIRADAGDIDISATLTGKKPGSPLLYAGMAIAVAGAVAFFYGLRRAALICWGLAGAFIAAGLIPSVAWGVIGIAVVIGGGVYVWVEIKNRRHFEALRAVVSGVAGLEKTNSSAQAAVKSEIDKHADDHDKKTIKAIKRVEDVR